MSHFMQQAAPALTDTALRNAIKEHCNMDIQYTADGIFVTVNGTTKFLDGWAIVKDWLPQATAALRDQAYFASELPSFDDGSLVGVLQAAETLAGMVA